ncbi:dTDP-4-dehydrorhamnose reductase [Pigmentiphaga sp. YJ18]|uniref:dTDP-4-dehydrorhamnose reductase n=1 Tax=Pigmentiphaga sp. YJ18 TaxID=3134907 RepID=UPI003118D967
MKILLFGKSGQVGWELQRALGVLGELIALDRHALGGDLAQPLEVARTIEAVRPDVVVNAAAYTAVDRAEQEASEARVVNATAVAAMSAVCRLVGAWLVHYSTDYVFDGRGATPWREDDPPAPLNVYGTTKLEGEQAIRDSECLYLLFRTSWVYAARGGNFAKTMLRLATERDELRIIDDQHGAPTSAELIADVTAHAIRQAVRDSRLSGTYHLAASGQTSWHGYAEYVLAAAERYGWSSRRARTVTPIPSSEFAVSALRPLNSRLDTTRLRQAFGLALPQWEVGVERMLAEILA